MKTKTCLIIGLYILATTISYAEPVGVNLLDVYNPPSTSSMSSSGSSNATTGQIFEKHDFISANANDQTTIANSSGTPIQIVIFVNRGDPKTTTGINLQNCGSITHVGPGSTAVCSPGDNGPIIISSDNGAKSASGSYQIK